jgi:hypothetical protein
MSVNPKKCGHHCNPHWPLRTAQKRVTRLDSGNLSAPHGSRFPAKIWRQDRLRATIANSVDPDHRPFYASAVAFGFYLSFTCRGLIRPSSQFAARTQLKKERGFSAPLPERKKLISL